MSHRHSWSLGSILPIRQSSSSAASISSGASTSSKRKRFSSIRNSFSLRRTSISSPIPEFEPDADNNFETPERPQSVARQSFCSENIAPGPASPTSTHRKQWKPSLVISTSVDESDAFQDAPESDPSTPPPVSPTGTILIGFDGPPQVTLDEDIDGKDETPLKASNWRDEVYLPGDDDSIVEEATELIRSGSLAASSSSTTWSSPLPSPDLSSFPLPPFRFEQQRSIGPALSPSPALGEPFELSLTPAKLARARKRFSLSGGASEWSHATLEMLGASPTSSHSALSLRASPERAYPSTISYGNDSPPVTPALSSCSTFSSPSSLRDMTRTPTSFVAAKRPDESLYTVSEDEKDLSKQDITTVMHKVDMLLASLDEARLDWSTTTSSSPGGVVDQRWADMSHLVESMA
ncbi:hypothetical protein OIO90_001906 [Microbotryomycetes sp. JL221]|nr:hypothetical protein OIO90_001906 [Microbotryomycetes sp. JL221]